MKRHLGMVAAITVLSMLGGCVASREVGLSPNIDVVNLDSLPPPSGSDYIFAADHAAKIRPYDRLKIEVFDVPELSSELEVNGDGSLRFPLIGTIDANDHTPNEFAVAIEDALRGRYILNPSVTVTFEERTGQTFSIGGEVKRPGQYVLPPNATLLEAVAAGGGMTEFAKTDDVLIIRSVNNQRYIGVYNLRAIQRGNYDDPQVFAQDIVMVGESGTRRLISVLVGIAPLLSSSIILIDRLNN